MKTLCKTVVLGSLVWAGGALAQQPVPSTLNYQGVLRDKTGAGVTQNLTLNFLIFSSATGGEPLWISQRRVAVEKGYFDVVLSESNGSVPADAKYNTLRGKALADAFVPREEDEEGMQRWIEVQVIANSSAYPLGARQLVTSAPYAFSAGNIRKVAGGFQVHDNLKVDGKLTVVGAAEALDTGFEGTVDLKGRLTSKGAVETLGMLRVDTPASFLQQRQTPEGTPMMSGPHTISSGSVASRLATVKATGTAYLHTFVSEQFTGTNTSFHLMGAPDPAVLESEQWSVTSLDRAFAVQRLLENAPCDGFLSVTVELASKNTTELGHEEGVTAELLFGKASEQLESARKLRLRHHNPGRKYTETVTVPISKGTACNLVLMTNGGTVRVRHAAFLGLNRSTTLTAEGI